jgi:predicted dehydrogenase
MNINVGVIGFGYWGPNLVRNLMETEGALVVACADKRPDRRTVAQQRYPMLTVTEDSDPIFDDPKIDAVVIATPVSTHYDLAKHALEAGKHVLVAKPMTRTTAEAEELIRMAETRRRLLMVDHTFIFTGAVRKIQELLRPANLASSTTSIPSGSISGSFNTTPMYCGISLHTTCRSSPTSFRSHRGMSLRPARTMWAPVWPTWRT